MTIDGAANGQAALNIISCIDKLYCINHLLNLVVRGLVCLFNLSLLVII